MRARLPPNPGMLTSQSHGPCQASRIDNPPGHCRVHCARSMERVRFGFHSYSFINRTTRNGPRLLIHYSTAIDNSVRHALEKLLEVLLADGQLALCPGFGILQCLHPRLASTSKKNISEHGLQRTRRRSAVAYVYLRVGGPATSRTLTRIRTVILFRLMIRSPSSSYLYLFHCLVWQ